jgi:NADH:ubiquinone oxidoreductase subunit 4 (subunit M)
MLIATVISLAYSLRFTFRVFLGKAKNGGENKIVDIPNYMKISLGVLVVLVILVGIYPTFFISLIQTVQIG